MQATAESAVDTIKHELRANLSTAGGALSDAVAMLTHIKNGGSYTVEDYIERLQRIEQAYACVDRALRSLR